MSTQDRTQWRPAPVGALQLAVMRQARPPKDTDAPGGSVADAALQRVLALQVEWCAVSIARAGTYALPPGSIIKRRQADIAHLDVFRTLWADESGRWSCLEELRASYDA